jgi:hypothetical protein
MAKVRGNDGIVTAAGNVVASINRFTLDEAMEPIEDTDLGTQEKEFAAGDTSWTASIECKWDKADTTGQGAMTIGASLAFVMLPEGNTSGDESRSGTGLIVGRGAVNEKGSMVMQTFSIQGSGALTVGAVA